MFISSKELRENRPYREAVAALDALISQEGSDHATRAYGEVVQDTLLANFAKARGLKRSNGAVCISRLHGKQCALGYQFSNHRTAGGCFPPGTDHPSLWNKDGKPYCFVSQPYGLSHRTLREILAYCEANGFEVEIDAQPSWHFPGRVLTVIFTKAESVPTRGE
jgi:hypothetical protein